MMVPGLAHRIIMFAGIRIDHQRQGRQAVQMRQRRGRIFQGDTVDPHRHHLRVIRQGGHHLAQRRAVAEMFGVAQREGVPGAGAGILLQQGRQGLDLSE